MQQDIRLILCSAQQLERVVTREPSPPDVVISFDIAWPEGMENLFSSPNLAETLGDKRWEERQLILRAYDVEELEQVEFNGQRINMFEPPAVIIADALDHFEEYRPKDRAASVVVNCWRGESRSTAIGLGLLAYCAPLASPRDLVERLLGLRPSARPNKILVKHVDDFLMWKGTLCKAIDDNAQIQANRKNYVPPSRLPQNGNQPS